MDKFRVRIVREWDDGRPQGEGSGGAGWLFGVIALVFILLFLLR